MAQMFNMTRSLRSPELLVKGCLEMKTAKNLKPQTMLNYLSIFKLFVDQCYLNREIAKCDDGFDRMKAAIAAARKAFSPAALNAHQASEKMLALVPSNEQVRLRYRQVLEILATNMQQNTLSYRKQQALNFFLLQARINTRLVKLSRFIVSTRSHIPLFFYYFNRNHITLFFIIFTRNHIPLICFSTRNHIPLAFSLFLLEITSFCFFFMFLLENTCRCFLLFLLEITSRCFFIISTRNHIPLFFSLFLLEITCCCFFHRFYSKTHAVVILLFLLEITSRCFFFIVFTRNHIPLFFC